jgi:hypothetical protein
MCGVTGFADVWKHNQCCNDIHTCSSPEVLPSDLACWMNHVSTLLLDTLCIAPS